MNSRITSFLIVCLLGACADSFEEYNAVTGLRVLGLRAEPPELESGAEAQIDALVISRAASHRWSWCPAPFGGEASDECPISEADLHALIRAVDPDAEVPPYDLGNAAQVSFAHSLPKALLAGFCEQINDVELPEGFTPPACNGRFDVHLKLVVEDGEERITATRELSLVYVDDLVANQNPSITGGEISVRGAPAFVLTTDAPTTVVRDVDYKLLLDVDPTSAEEFPSDEEDGPAQDRETLTMSWFYEAGAMDKSRSSFIEGFTDIDNLRENQFRTPGRSDFADETLRLFFVLRDDRGGLNWLETQLELVE